MELTTTKFLCICGLSKSYSIVLNLLGCDEMFTRKDKVKFTHCRLLDKGMIHIWGRIEQATKDFTGLLKMAHKNSGIFPFKFQTLRNQN